MRNAKKIISVLTLSLLTSVSVYAASLGSSSITAVYYTDDSGKTSAAGVDAYKKATVNGTMQETHSYAAGSSNPYSISIKLEKRTAWYTPNDVVDSSNYLNSSNSAACEKGQEFRTSADFAGGIGFTKINTSYSNN